MPENALDALKDLLASRERRIDLSEFFSVVTIEAIGQLTPDVFPMGEQPTEESVRERVERYEGILIPLLRPLFMGAYYSDLPDHARIWSRSLKRLIEAAGDQPAGQVFTIWDQMRYYPGLLGLYAVGVGAIAGGGPDVVARLLSELHFDNELLRSTRTAIEPAASLLLPAARPAATSYGCSNFCPALLKIWWRRISWWWPWISSSTQLDCSWPTKPWALISTAPSTFSLPGGGTGGVPPPRGHIPRDV